MSDDGSDISDDDELLPNLDDKEECRYRAFRDTEGHLTPAHYKILGLK